MTLEEILKRHPDTSANDWQPLEHGAWAHLDAEIDPECRIEGPAVLRGGEFHAGTFQGGEFFDGVFDGGTFHGGVFRGGQFDGGVFQGGEFIDGVYFGGEFVDGVFEGGSFHGGVFQSGAKTIREVAPWDITVQGEGDQRIAMGCECHERKYWLDNLDKIAAKHDAREYVPAVREAITSLEPAKAT